MMLAIEALRDTAAGYEWKLAELEGRTLYYFDEERNQIKADPPRWNIYARQGADIALAHFKEMMKKKAEELINENG